MKKGKTLKLNGYENIKTSYGTVDFKEFKSLYVNIQSWLLPKVSSDKWDRVVGNFARDVKQLVHQNINPKLFSENFILDMDLRSSGIVSNKKSFMNLEITLYVKPQQSFKSVEIRNEIKKLINEINKDSLLNNKYFMFSQSKKKNIIEYI
jgi:hypothetical protein